MPAALARLLDDDAGAGTGDDGTGDWSWVGLARGGEEAAVPGAEGVAAVMRKGWEARRVKERKEEAAEAAEDWGGSFEGVESSAGGREGEGDLRREPKKERDGRLEEGGA